MSNVDNNLPDPCPPQMMEDEDPYEQTVYRIKNWKTIIDLLPTTQSWREISDEQVSWIKKNIGVSTSCRVILAEPSINLLIFSRPITELPENHPHNGLEEQIKLMGPAMTKCIPWG